MNRSMIETEILPQGPIDDVEHRSIPPAEAARIKEVLQFMKQINSDPSRKAFPDGLLPEEVGRLF